MHLISKPQDSRFPYLPGIDGLRAIAVLAVFFYHANVSWMPGGFLGVDVFFVISGYLITSLLLREFRRGGQVRLARFWLRRAQRLLPAVGVLIAVCMIAAAILEPDRIDALRADALASLGYFANWHFIYSQQSYFDQFQAPSLFTHLWSLSVEEQFYLFWPLVFAAGMKLFGRGKLVLGVLAGALGSVVLAWILFDPGGADASRVYYGTDTHAVGLLGGVALALVWSPIELRRRKTGPLVGPILDVVGVLALAYIALSFIHVHDYDLALWHGGYLWLALVTTLLLAVLAHPASSLGGILGRAPILWLGLRSYSFYLWHWPVLVLTRPGEVDLPKGILIPLQLIFVLLLADLSYRFVELPFRGRAKMPSLPDGRPRLARPALVFSVLAVLGLVGWSGIFGGENHHLAAASGPTVARIKAEPVNPPAREAPAKSRAAKHPPRIIAIGDSVMIGAASNLASRLGPGFSMNAKVGRQANEFVEIVQQLRREGHHPNALIIQMGNNGALYGEDMEAIQKATADVGQLFFINDHAPVSWIEESNHTLAEAASAWPHTTLVDWKSVAEENEGLLWDGIHLKPAAAGLYARLVSTAVHEKVAFPPKPKPKPKQKPKQEPKSPTTGKAGAAGARRPPQ
jgi:peptidoglycan/LPS O-acetylase OafA/YrhL